PHVLMQPPPLSSATAQVAHQQNTSVIDPSAVRSVLPLSLAAIASFLTFLWAVLHSKEIDDYFPADSRVGPVLLILGPVWFMGTVFWFRALRILHVLHWPLRQWLLSHLSFGLATIALVSVVGVT